MHRGSAPSRGRSWLWGARVLVIGVVCGGFQILLLVAGGVLVGQLSGGPSLERPSQPLPLGLVLVLSACSYLVISFIEGFLASSRKGDVHAGMAAARLVAGMSVLTFAFLIGVAAVIVVTSQGPTCSPQCGDPHDLRFPLAFVLLLFIPVEGLWAWMVSTLGGWIGGVMGKRNAPPAPMS